MIEVRYLGKKAELDCAELAATYMALQSMELALIGTGVGGGIKHTSELRVLNYKKAMQSADMEEWGKEIRNKKVQFNNSNTLTPVLKSSLPNGSKVLTTTWAIKLKSNVTCQGWLNTGVTSK